MATSPSNWINFDPTKPIRGLIKFFMFVGIWPIKYKYRFFYIIYGILFQLIFSYAYTIFEIGGTISVTNLKDMTEAIFVACSEVSMCIRMTNFIVHFEEAENFLNRIKSFKLYNQEECDLYTKRLTFFKRIMIFYLSCAGFTITFSSLPPLFSDEMKIPYPGWYPCDWTNNMICYRTVYFYQTLGIILLGYTLVTLENYQIFCMVCSGAQLEILGMRMKKIGYVNHPINKINNRQLVFKKQQDNLPFLLECIKKHKLIMEFVSDIERVFNIPFLFQLFCSSVIFCLIGFQIITAELTMVSLAYNICYLATMMNEIFLPCYFGTQLTFVNDNLPTALYSSNWPDQPQSFKKAVILFLEYLKRPKVMMSGKIFTLTLFSFLTVINRSYSLFAVLRNVIKS